MGVTAALATRQARTLIGTWIAVAALAGVIAATEHNDGHNAQIRTAGTAPTVTIPTTVPESLPPEIPPPEVTVPDVTVPAVSLPPVTLPSLDVPAPPFLPTSQGLWLVDADQPAGRLISGATTTNLSFSPDGTQLAMTVETGKDSDGIPTRALEVLDISSGATRQLAPGVRIPQAVQWSPDGQWIAFTTLAELNDGSGNSAYLWLVHPDGTGVHRLAPADEGWRLAWSPDSRRLAQPQPNLHDVAVVDVATGAQSPLSFDRAYIADWLPDGRIVASGLDGTTVVIDPATDAESTISDGRFSRPSPAGNVVAVREGGVGGQTGIVPIGGGPFRTLALGSPIDWSADGASVSVSDTDMDVSVCDATTGSTRLAVIGDAAQGWTVSPGPWSPVGRKFLVMVWSYEASYSP